MFNFEVFSFEEKLDSSIYDKIIEFDRITMEKPLQSANVSFPEEKRRKFFKEGEQFVVAYDTEGEIAGYSEFGKSYMDESFVYVTSLQIKEEYRKGVLIGDLLGISIDIILKGKFKGLTCHVYKSNTETIEFYRKVGFGIKEIEGNDNQYIAECSIENLQTGILKRIHMRGVSSLNSSKCTN